MNATELRKILSHLIFESGDDGRQLAVPYVIGEKGDGKSTIIRELCESKDAAVIDIRLALEDVPDLKGFPHIVNGKTEFATPEWIPHGTSLEKYSQYKYVVIFFDEMARAKLDVHQVIFKMILDFAHQDIIFDKKVRFVAADNPATKDYKGVNKLDSALMNRFVSLHYDGPTVQEWTEYEQDKSDSMITRFINEQTQLFRKGNATPRTLSKIGRRILKSSIKEDKGSLFNIIDGMCGPEFAASFIRYYESSYKAVKAASLFETGNAEFEKNINIIRGWNTADGKMSDAISDTASDILEYFRSDINVIHFSLPRMVQILNAFPDDKTWMIVSRFAANLEKGYPKSWKVIHDKMINSPDIKSIILAVSKKIGVK